MRLIDETGEASELVERLCCYGLAEPCQTVPDRANAAQLSAWGQVVRRRKTENFYLMSLNFVL